MAMHNHIVEQNQTRFVLNSFHESLFRIFVTVALLEVMIPMTMYSVLQFYSD